MKYNVAASKVSVGSIEAVLLKVGFGEPSNNDAIVIEVDSTLKTLESDGTLGGGKLVLVNGPASLPVAMVLAHHLAHRYAAVGCFDPKLQGYVVAISHNPEMLTGSILGVTEVKEVK